MALSVPVLQASYDAIMFMKDVLDAVEVNKKSIKFLAERLERLLPGILKLMASNPDDSILLMAQGLYDCCMEARNFIEQFTNKGKHWLMDKARKVYNRNADKDTIADILTRIQKFAEDLNLGVTINIQDLLAQLTELFKADTQKLQETLEGMRREAAQRGDKHEQQHGEIRNALAEVRQLLIMNAGGSGAGVVDVGASSGDAFSSLPSLNTSYKFVVKESGADCSSDDDDSASLGEGAFGEVFLMRGRIDGKPYAVTLIKG
jgi:hypothetical protein